MLTEVREEEDNEDNGEDNEQTYGETATDEHGEERHGLTTAKCDEDDRQPVSISSSSSDVMSTEVGEDEDNEDTYGGITGGHGEERQPGSSSSSDSSSVMPAEAGKEEENMTVDLEGDQRQIASYHLLTGESSKGCHHGLRLLLIQLAGGTLKVTGLKQLSLTEG
ncbi:hypothetical protein PBY51_020858 [Eleginops maclovinus]|uniref:Uncharacterized protein n=1 Tax=Eleginops maclovinus TaxID=56733 RepID=A0AAN7XU82_ELEMC|nr:hypothetical protein PBY51_020858 [Eleginops maclovinus]